MLKATYEYSYKGPVSIFCFDKQKIHSYSWSGVTIASSQEQAITNLKDQYRRKYGLNKRTPLVLLKQNLKKGDT